MEHLSVKEISERLYEMSKYYTGMLNLSDVNTILEAAKRLKKLEDLEDDGK